VIDFVAICKILIWIPDFQTAKAMLHGRSNMLRLSNDIIEEICLASSREFYDNSTSGNYKFGDMKLAYDWKVQRRSLVI
jgi:hypothetical protein